MPKTKKKSFKETIYKVRRLFHRLTLILTQQRKVMLERENIAKEVDMDSREVVEVIAKEVDDERRRK